VSYVQNELFEKLPSKLRTYIRTPNWTNAEEMFNQTGSRCDWLCYLCLSTVREGDLTLAWRIDQPLIFGPGMHNLCCWYSNVTAIPLSRDYIRHGPLHIITVSQGALGYGEDKGIPILLAPGRHKIQSNEFIWHGLINLRKEKVDIGNWQLVRVDFGRVGVATIQGKLAVLNPGIHLFEPPDLFIRFVTTRMQILKLPKTVMDSSDYVPLQVSANVSYLIRDPMKMIEHVQDQQAESQIKEVSQSAIANIIRSSTLGDIAASAKKASDSSSSDRSEGETFHARLHAEFMSAVGDRLLRDIGIEILNINIEELSIKNKDLARQISSQAVKIADLERQHKLIDKEGEVKRAEAKLKKEIIIAQAEAEYIKKSKQAEAAAFLVRSDAQAQAESHTLHAKADMEVLTMKAKADAEAVTTRARADTEVITMKAKAETEAYAMKKDAEASHSERMNKNPELHQLAVLKATLEPQALALKNCQSVAYVPHLPGILQKQNMGIFSNLKDLTGMKQLVPEM